MEILRGVRAAMREAGVLAAILLVAQGCTGEESFALPPLEASAPDSRNQVVCATWARSSCAYDERCSGAIDTVWQNLDTCVARETLACELAADDPDVSFDEGRVRDCPFPSDCTSPRPTCWPPGKAPGGSPCLWGEACQGGLCLGSASLGVCGICLCGAGCPAGEICQPASAAGTCVPEAPPVDGPCVSSSECPSGLCEAVTDASGQCAPFATAGQACGDGKPLCRDDAYCDDTRLCRVISSAPFGATCGSPVDGGAFTFCGGFATCVGGACVAPARDGDRCDPNQGIGCVWPAQCIESHCVFPTLADCVP